MNIFDLAAKPVEVELKHPMTGEGLNVKVKIVGKNSRQFKERFYETVSAVSRLGKEVETGERMKVAELNSIELVAACIVGWDDNEFFGGEYTVERAKDIVSRPELAWVKSQVEDAITEDSLFFIA